jgi:hypothetical protein
MMSFMHVAIPLLPYKFMRRGAYLSTGYVFMAWYLVKYRNNFTLLYTKKPGQIYRSAGHVFSG